ncbi:CBS domain-containing protein [Hymenobacter aerilatus]|uniref:CBS domain-containing protein n=1 Tax=Hymenobacter aerilatus TaxID=2932251 RepID=A0A8T9SRJ8_9BACT|nr:CBS domain-containing protein [Hymenobacter aerilatus]UOR04377.1 CBS domain-containing protein [Hymenobacter aerilatus]
MLSMTAEDLLNQMIPPLKVSDTAGKAAKWLEEFHVSQLPVLDGRHYIGLVTDSDVTNYEHPAHQLAVLPLGYATAYVQRHQHFYNIMEAAVQHKIQLVPVLNDQREYLGVVTISDVLAAFGQSLDVAGRGGILVLSMNERDYSLSQISRYVEENNAKILSAHVAQDEEDSYKIRLTLKLNTPQIQRIVATLERFGFVITAQFSGAEDTVPEDQERYDALLKYLSL